MKGMVTTLVEQEPAALLEQPVNANDLRVILMPADPSRQAGLLILVHDALNQLHVAKVDVIHRPEMGVEPSGVGRFRQGREDF